MDDEYLNSCHFVTLLPRQQVYEIMVKIIEDWAKKNNRLVAVSTHWNQLVKGSTTEFTFPHIHLMYEKGNYRNNHNQVQKEIYRSVLGKEPTDL